MTELWYGTRGPKDAPIVVVAESWGAEEAVQCLPLVGESGKELTRILLDAGLNPNEILYTNVVSKQPQSNEMWRFFEPEITAKTKPQVRGLHPTQLVLEELNRLYRQIAAHPRRLIITLGNWALWAFHSELECKTLHKSNSRPIPKELKTRVPVGIQTWRGSMLYTNPIPDIADAVATEQIRNLKLLPIYHPAAILRQWGLRDVTVHDLRTRPCKALADDWRKQTNFLFSPSFDTCISVLDGWIEKAQHEPLQLACDIETLFRSIVTCIGFADAPDFAISIPLIRRNDDATGVEPYWSFEQELELFRRIRALLVHPNVRWIGQNFIYDTQYILRDYGVCPVLFHDTMIAQNVIFPGEPKALPHIASLYNEYYWYWKDEKGDEDTREWNWRKTPFKNLLQYNCLDVAHTFESATNQQIYLKHLGLEAQFALKMRVHHMCLRMMNRGARFDVNRVSELYSNLLDATNRIKTELLQIIPQDWIQPATKPSDTMWYSSSQQTAKLFYELLGFRVVKHKKTRQPTVGKDALDKLLLWYPEYTGLFRRLRELSALENSMQVITSHTEPNGRMSCSYNPAGTETHRLSSSTNAFGRGTNLQNLTVGDE